jgi:hypothetical protein
LSFDQRKSDCESPTVSSRQVETYPRLPTPLAPMFTLLCDPFSTPRAVEGHVLQLAALPRP